MSQLIYRSVTPIFKFNFDCEDAELEYSGNFNEFSFRLTLKRYEHGENSVNQILMYADETTRQKLISLHIHPSMGSTYYFLIVDVTTSKTAELANFVNIAETDIISKAILTSLHLHSTSGITFHNTYCFRSPKHPNFSMSEVNHFSRQSPFSNLDNNNSVFRYSSIVECRATFEKLLYTMDDDKCFSSKILNLAIEYHLQSFKSDKVAHAFLLEMVVFEILFKKNDTEVASNAAARISKLLATDRKNGKDIKKEFFNNEDSFSKNRNKLTHGNMSVNLKEIKASYPSLYRYMANAIIELLNLHASDSDFNNYDDLIRLAENRYRLMLNTNSPNDNF